MCPLCRVAHKADREYIWQFYDERSNDGAVIDQVSRAYGFCAEHIEMLRRIDLEDMKSTLAITFENSPGLCFPHFKLAWEHAPSAADRALLLDVLRRASRSLLHELREHVRKHDHKYSGEPKGPEQGSWQRAIKLTAGWPPPAQTAARPED